MNANEKSTLDESRIESAISILNACLHPVRLMILKQLLAEGPQEVGLLALRLQTPPTKVVEHLEALKQGRLVRKLLTGTWMAEVPRIQTIQALLGQIANENV